MTTYVLLNRACDGTYNSTHATEQEALQAMAKWFGEPVEKYRIGITYYSDWGNRLKIEQRPDGWSTNMEEKLARAYDARECDEATPAQLAFLDKHGF